jgi:O-methyltransferase
VNREKLWDKYARLFPPKVLRSAALPLQRHASTDDAFRWESARMLTMAFGFLANERVRGDYAEFGVLAGRTFLEAYLASKRFELESMAFHAYDSFEGLPHVQGIDAEGPFTTGQFASPRSVFDSVTEEVPLQRKTVTHGFYDASLLNAPRHELALVWIDCDLYESTVPVLDFITDQVTEGTVLVFDDWYCYRGRPDRGEQRACVEWLADNPHITLVPYRTFHWAGQSFIVNLG